ncbi:transposase [Nocardia asteroides]|uniref:transposase n=1 Tax=Nocardia asteroides TaxID=1824 RepID=UPI001E395B05|nr:transposase [Nocardia asteroides]UGT60371.1 transposase [Nocardia asteroides]
MTGLPVELIAGLAAEVEPVWRARQEARRAVRVRAPGAGTRYKLVFLDRLLVTLVHLRHGVTHDVLAAWFDVDRSTVTRAIGEIRPILAERGCRAGNCTRLRTLDEVVEFLGAAADYAIMDATEVRVRRPAARALSRDKFVSGKSRQNAIKTLVITDSVGRLLFCGATAPGSVADITQARRSGLPGMLAGSGARVLADAGYQGLGTQNGGAVITPPHRKMRRNPPAWYEQLYREQRKAHSRLRIRVEHAIAHLKNWRSLSRHLPRRASFAHNILAAAGLLSDFQHVSRPQST